MSPNHLAFVVYLLPSRQLASGIRDFAFESTLTSLHILVSSRFPAIFNAFLSPNL